MKIYFLKKLNLYFDKKRNYFTYVVGFYIVHIIKIFIDHDKKRYFKKYNDADIDAGRADLLLNSIEKNIKKY